MSPPSHICPKCHKPQGGDAFVNEKGKPTKWCFWCRTSYRDRLTNLHQRDATKPKREEAISVDAITKQEGYKDHPLATLLALSHIAGAKRALAVRDGNSWRGKKAWRAYYKAKRELEAKVGGFLDLAGAAEELANLMDGVRDGSYKPDSFTTQPIRNALKIYLAERDPNSSDAS